MLLSQQKDAEIFGKKSYLCPCYVYISRLTYQVLIFCDKLDFKASVEIYTVWNVYLCNAPKCVFFLSEWLDST